MSSIVGYDSNGSFAIGYNSYTRLYNSNDIDYIPSCLRLVTGTASFLSEPMTEKEDVENIE